MVLYGVRLLINIFDLFIYRRFLEVFIGKRKTSVEFSIFLLIICEIVGSAVNQLGINWLNFVTMLTILSVYICQYEAKLRSKVITVCLYMGLVVIAEPIGYIVYRILARGVFEDYQDVEKYQEQIQDIKHDMKNKLAVLYDGVERGEREFLRDTLAEC